MSGTEASGTSHIVAWTVGTGALLLRSVVIAGEAGLSAVGATRATELGKLSRSGKAVARLKSDTEATAGAIRVALALSVSLALVAATYEAMSIGAALSAMSAFGVAVLCGALFWVVIVAADAIPGSLAAAQPEVWALRTAPLLLLLRYFLAPMSRGLGLFVEALVRPFGAHVRYGLPSPPLDEIERLLTHSRDVNAPEPALVRSLFDFGERTAKDTMVPRTEVTAVAIDANPREVTDLLMEQGHTRIPVYKGTLDTIVGVIHVKDLLPLLANPELIILQDLLRVPVFVPWNRPIAKVMRELQKKRQHLAVVVDEYGGVAGIITLADIVAQIVGDIKDEFDDEPGDVVPVSDTAALVKAEMRVAEFNEAFGAQVPEDAGYETIGGFVSFLSGALPAEGDRFFHGGYELQVAKRSPNRVLELKVTKLRAPPEPGMANPV